MVQTKTGSGCPELPGGTESKEIHVYTAIMVKALSISMKAECVKGEPGEVDSQSTVHGTCTCTVVRSIVHRHVYMYMHVHVHVHTLCTKYFSDTSFYTFMFQSLLQ